MAIKKTDDKNYHDIGDAIRAKSGESALYLPSQMAAKIRSIRGNTGIVISEQSGTEHNIKFEDSNGTEFLPSNDWQYHGAINRGVRYGGDGVRIIMKVCFPSGMASPDNDVRFFWGSSEYSPATGLFSAYENAQLLAGFPNESSLISGDIYDADIIFLSVGLESDTWYYIVQSIKDGIGRFRVYDETGYCIAWDEISGVYLNSDYSNYLAVGGAWNPNATQQSNDMLLGAKIDLSELLIEGSNIITWGEPNEITKDMGKEDW